MIKNILNELSHFQANVIYCICIFVAFLINVFFYYQVSFLDFIEIMGTFIQIALPCYVLVPVIAKNDVKGAKQMISFLVVALIVTYILKFSIPIKRPYGGSMSFPSGHTVGAFSGAVFLSYRYGKRYFIFTMPLAIFVGFSRIYTQNHWPTDVFASIILCFILGRFMVDKYTV